MRQCVHRRPTQSDFVRMTSRELKDLRVGIGFSMADIAACLGVPKSTYARYEDGTAAVPSGIKRAAVELRQINETFMAELPARVDARLAEEWPNGIPSEV